MERKFDIEFLNKNTLNRKNTINRFKEKKAIDII